MIRAEVFSDSRITLIRMDLLGYQEVWRNSVQFIIGLGKVWFQLVVLSVHSNGTVKIPQN